MIELPELCSACPLELVKNFQIGHFLEKKMFGFWAKNIGRWTNSFWQGSQSCIHRVHRKIVREKLYERIGLLFFLTLRIKFSHFEQTIYWFCSKLFQPGSKNNFINFIRQWEKIILRDCYNSSLFPSEFYEGLVKKRKKWPSPLRFWVSNYGTLV